MSRCGCGVLCFCPGTWDYVGSLAGMSPEETERFIAPYRTVRILQPAHQERARPMSGEPPR